MYGYDCGVWRVEEVAGAERRFVGGEGEGVAVGGGCGCGGG